MNKQIKYINKGKWFLGIGIVVVIAIAFTILWSWQQSKAKQESTREIPITEVSIEESVGELKGFEREISQEEYDFYAYFVKRDLTEELSEEAIAQKVMEYINTVNATFYLGSKWGVCEPYDFELMKTRMEQENDQRKVKKDKNEPIYGLEKFDLNGYFQYLYSNLELDMQDYIIAHMDDSILEQANTYYDNHTEDFKVKSSVTYTVTKNSESETITANREDMKVMQNVDGNLFDFLSDYDGNATYSDEIDGVVREVTINEVTYEEEGFEENKSDIVRTFIDKEYLNNLVAIIAKNNPVKFVLS